MNFKITQRKTIHEGRIFQTQQVQAELPDGKARTYDLVLHRGAVAIVPVDEQKRIWFVRQYRIGAEKVLLEVPAGCFEPGETPEVTAQREIQEEIGMAAQQIKKIGAFFMSPGYSSEYLYIFLATGLKASQLEADDDEFLQLEKLPISEALALARQGQIEDGKTLAALFLAEQELLAMI